MITQDEIKALLHYDPIDGSFVRLISTARCVKVGDVAGYKNNCGYISIGLLGKFYLAHRLAWMYTYGEFPEYIDHINGIRDDNRIANLRSVTRKQNGENTFLRKDNKTGLRGVSFHKAANKWRAQIKHNGKKMHLGFFNAMEDASMAYQAASAKFFTHAKETLND
jgi:hypothetical protein